MSSIHHIAENGFGAGTNDLYHRSLIVLFFYVLFAYYPSARPSYISDALSYIRDAVRSNPPFNVVESV